MFKSSSCTDLLNGFRTPHLQGGGRGKVGRVLKLVNVPRKIWMDC